MNLRSTRARAAAAAAGALLLLVALSPLLPDGGPEPGISPRSERETLLPSGQVGPGEVTPEMQAEIDRVVAEGQRRPVSARLTPYARVAAATRCAMFEGQRYCLGLGWTTSSPEEAARRLASAATAPRRDGRTPEQTGDLDPLAAADRAARMSSVARTAAERAELTAAARAVAKVWLIRHEIQHVPLPADFARRHPEAYAPPAQARETGTPAPSPSPTTTGTTSGTGTTTTATTTTSTTPVAATPPAVTPKRAVDYPESFTILKQRQVRPQQRYYWCGPTAMQMIGWGWTGARRGQAYWAQQLHTTTAGTAITDMVRVVNQTTGWDDPDHAGPYIVLDIGDFTYNQWYLLMMKHVHDYTAPVVLHPILLKKYYPYLDDDASGHFQVGRGYDKNPGGQKLLGYFEPWDQSTFDPSEPRIARTQWQSAYKSYRANLAHFQHNVGV